MTPEEVIGIIEKLNMEENLKKELVNEVSQKGLTEEVKQRLADYKNEVEGDIKTLDEIMQSVQDTQVEVDKVEKDATDQIEQVASDTEDQLKQLDEEADKAKGLADQIATDIEQQQMDDARKKLNQ